MKTLRDYEQLIREQVAKISEAHPFWNFTVRAFSKDRVKIRWSYLDYCKERDNCFFLKLSYLPEDNEYFLRCQTPQGEFIDGDLIQEDDTTDTDITFERAIKHLIYIISDYAYERY